MIHGTAVTDRGLWIDGQHQQLHAVHGPSHPLIN
jgi:hypothetical protein